MLIHWLWLAERPDLREQDKLRLLEHFSDPEGLYCAKEEALEPLSWLTQEAKAALLDKGLTSAEKLLEQCAKEKIHILPMGDSRYPQRLKSIADPPLLLYYKGILPPLNGQLLIGVVGTRKASAYGKTMAKKLAGQISLCGGTVVTGMALGIDSQAAWGAMEQGGSVVGVLGCGVDKVYPTSNRQLYAKAESCGCLISEYPPGTPAYAWNFPRRNRIISGMSNGVLVVEAPEKSGALITAGQAMEQGRDVFVVPGNVGVASCAGSNSLLRQGAIMAATGWDVVSEYMALYPDQLREVREEPPAAEIAPLWVAQELPQSLSDKKSVDNGAATAYSGVNEEELTAVEAALLSGFAPGENLIDDVIAASGIPSGDATAALTVLELKGYLRSAPGKRAVRVK